MVEVAGSTGNESEDASSSTTTQIHLPNEASNITCTEKVRLQKQPSSRRPSLGLPCQEQHSTRRLPSLPESHHLATSPVPADRAKLDQSLPANETGKCLRNSETSVDAVSSPGEHKEEEDANSSTSRFNAVMSLMDIPCCSLEPFDYLDSTREPTEGNSLSLKTDAGGEERIVQISRISKKLSMQTISEETSGEASGEEDPGLLAIVERECNRLSSEPPLFEREKDTNQRDDIGRHTTAQGEILPGGGATSDLQGALPTEEEDRNEENEKKQLRGNEKLTPTKSNGRRLDVVPTDCASPELRRWPSKGQGKHFMNQIDQRRYTEKLVSSERGSLRIESVPEHGVPSEQELVRLEKQDNCNDYQKLMPSISGSLPFDPVPDDVGVEEETQVVVELAKRTGLPVPAKWASQVSYVPTDKSVVDIFEFYASKQPDAPAIRWGNEQWSYGSLNEQANRIAHLLRSKHFGITKEEPIAFFMEQSAYPVIAALAIVKAGGSYVPLDPTFQQSHIEYVLQNTGARILIHDDSTADRCADLIEYDGYFLDLDDDVDLILSQPSTDPSNHFGIDGNSRFHIIYTSGSTGKPKGIEILHQGFIRLSLNTNWINITSSSKFASMANYAFDASSFEIWSSLLNGAEIVILPRSAALNPKSLKRFLAQNKITQLFLTTQLFHFVARELPDAFGTLEQVVVGGEALSPEWSKAVLSSSRPPKRLTNGYGPAENSAASTFHDVQLDDIRDGYSVPIGIPLMNSELLVLNEKMEPVNIGEVGEICLSGPGLARGYMNRPDITAEKYVDHPYKPGERLYRSGDLARWSENGLLYYEGKQLKISEKKSSHGRCANKVIRRNQILVDEGRRDRQVKIRGFRIELSGIEAVIRKAPDLIKDVAVIVREDRPGNRKIVAYCIPTKEAILNDMQRIHGLCSKLRLFLESEMPSYMVPSAFILVTELPITPNGKLNTKQLPRVSDILSMDPSRVYPPSTDTEIAVAKIWMELLNVKNVSIHSEFQDLGGDSLNAAKLLILVEEIFSVKCPAYEFFGLPTIANLSRIIDLLKSKGDSEGGEGAYIDLTKEVQLDPEIQAESPYFFSEPKKILLTGATGFLGAYLLRDLVHDEKIENIFALVRASNNEHALERIRSNLQKYEIWHEAMEKKISAVAGDFSKHAFGMSETAYEELSGIVDTVIHNGAKVDYTAPYANHKEVNVDGTAKVIKFCFHGLQKSLHFLSTLAVFGPIGFTMGVKDLYEDTDLLQCVEPLQADMGYAQSKWVAEQILGLAKKRGLRTSIFRPGFIFCDGETGLSNTADFMVRCTVACIRLGYYPLLHNQSKEFLTVDFASAAILALTKEERHLNRNYHLVRPDVKKHPSITEYFEMLREHGYDLRAMEFRDWVDVLSRACMEQDSHPMLPLMPMMAETIRDDRTRWEVYDNMPSIHCQNLSAGLEGTSVVFKNVDHGLLGKYLGYLQVKGMLPSLDQADQPVDRLTMKSRRSSSIRFKYRPSGRRMTRLSAFLSEAGSDRKSLLFTAGSNLGRKSAVSKYSSPSDHIDVTLSGRKRVVFSGDDCNSQGAGKGRTSGLSKPKEVRFSARLSRISRLQGSIRESFHEEDKELGGKADFSVHALIREEFKEMDEEEFAGW